MKLICACTAAAALWFAVPAFATGVNADGQVTAIGVTQTQYCFSAAGQAARKGNARKRWRASKFCRTVSQR
jgi:hypothetical protein